MLEIGHLRRARPENVERLARALQVNMRDREAFIREYGEAEWHLELCERVMARKTMLAWYEAVRRERVSAPRGGRPES